MKLLALAVCVFAVGAPSKTVRLAIVHTVQGCHVWQSTRSLGAAPTIKVAAGTKVELRVNCPMDFSFRQVRGPRVAAGDVTFHTGTTRTIVFRRRGLYVFAAKNLQSSEQAGLQTLGPDNDLLLTVRVT